MIRRSRLLGGGLAVPLVILGLLQSCRESSRPPSITDRLMALNRQLLVDSNPRAVYQAAICETARLFDVLGPEAARESISAALPQSYTWDDSGTSQRVESLLAGGTFPAGGQICDSLNRTAPKLEVNTR